MNKGIMKNTGVAIFFIVFALVYMLGTSRITSFSPFGNRGLDSQSIPQMLGVLMCALAALQVIVTIQKNKSDMRRSASCKHDAKTEEAPPTAKSASKINPVVVGSIALLIVYVVIYNKLGFILSTAFYLITATMLLTPGEKRGRMMIFVIPFSLVMTVAIYYAFTKYLTLFLPRGVLG